MLASAFCRLSGKTASLAPRAGALAASHINVVQARPFSNKGGNKPEYAVPFGKHMGTPISQVPEDYLKFICEQRIFEKHPGMLEAIKATGFPAESIEAKPQQQGGNRQFNNDRSGGFNGGGRNGPNGGNSFERVQNYRAPQHRGGDGFNNNSGRPGMRGDAASAQELAWNSLISQPHKWQDMRPVKKNPRGPDFKSMDGKDALWLESKYPLPDFVKSELPSIEGKIRPWMSTEQKWANLFEVPENWFDLREQKTRDAQPDFREKAHGGMALWLQTKFPLPEGVEKKISDAGSLWDAPPPRR